MNDTQKAFCIVYAQICTELRAFFDEDPKRPYVRKLMDTLDGLEIFYKRYGNDLCSDSINLYRDGAILS